MSEDELLDMLSCQDNLLDTISPPLSYKSTCAYDHVALLNFYRYNIFQYHKAPQRRIPSLLVIRLKSDCGEYMVERGANGTAVMGWVCIFLLLLFE